MRREMRTVSAATSDAFRAIPKRREVFSRGRLRGLVPALLLLVAPNVADAEVEVFGEVAKITAVDGSEESVFGIEVALAGDRLFVGARQDGTGAAYVYELDDAGEWVLATKLTAPGELNDNDFGEALSAQGDRLAVGARNDAAPLRGNGVAYIYERSGGGDWLPVARMRGDGNGLQLFGGSISLDGDRVAIGALNDNVLGFTSGSAYLFERSPEGDWLQAFKLFGADTTSGDQFGTEVSLDGDRVAVSAIGDDDMGLSSGSVYVFEREPSGSWLEVAKVTAPDGGAFDEFGEALVLDGDRLMVGVVEDDDFGFSSGAVHVYRRNAEGGWEWIQKLTALDAGARGEFGSSLSISGDRLAIGSAPSLFGGAPGAAYLFEPNLGGEWEQVERLAALDGAANDRFGYSVALDEDRLVIGAQNDDDLGDDSGSTFVFERLLVSPDLTISGTCPGELTFEVLGLTPRDGVQLYGAADVGATPVETEECEGTVLELDRARLLRRLSTGFEQGLTFERTLGNSRCGLALQVLDERTCETSRVVVIPGG